MEEYQHRDYKLVTANDDVKQTKVYKIVSNLISGMARSGVINLGSGFCISMSDMVATALRQQGIKSQLVECTLTLTYTNTDPPEVLFLGFEEVCQPGEIDTHVVVVTKTDPPLLIDTSIQKYLIAENYGVVDIANTNEFDSILCETGCEKDNLRLIYKEKKHPKIPIAHHKSIIERIAMDNKIDRDITLLKWLNYVGICLSVFAVISVINQYFRWYV